MSSLSVLRGSTLKPFKLRRNNETYEAIEHEATIYRLAVAFDLRRSRECCQLAQELAKECKVILSTGMIQNCVWTELE